MEVTTMAVAGTVDITIVGCADFMMLHRFAIISLSTVAVIRFVPFPRPVG